MEGKTNKQIERLGLGLRLKPNEIPLENLFPLFVPDSFFEYDSWPGPYELLLAKGIGLTWAIEQPGQTMLYVNQELENYWNSKQINWRDVALNNLRKNSAELPWTHEFDRDSGGIYAVAMMHEDGYGPSRLLLKEILNELFPDGYRVALPEMSCGLAISVTLSASEEAELYEIVQECFTKGTRPLAQGIFLPEELTTPRNS
ncbi:MAG TPA: hypothetical protein VNO70_22185 [Blastocatellia bacterium]|nr:hypothetical protein [Blastocatellia bacterium]